MLSEYIIKKANKSIMSFTIVHSDRHRCAAPAAHAGVMFTTKMDRLLIRFWFKSEDGLGIGVTAYSLEDAIDLIKSQDIAMMLKPNFDSYTENVDIQDLDQNHVIPNMGVCTNRGVWFPNVR